MVAAVSIEDLSFTYRESERPALQNLQGLIEEGTFIVVMGHGGAGKSSLCCTLNSLIPNFFRGKYQGRVLVKGEEVARHKVAEMSRIVGLVLQDFEAQLFSTNVELEMAFGPENHCLPRPEIERRIQHYLSFVGLEKMRRREPATLSGGQKQRLAIGSVLALEPKVLVMDEPTTDLDPQGREEVLSVARSIREERPDGPSLSNKIRRQYCSTCTAARTLPLWTGRSDQDQRPSSLPASLPPRKLRS